jgi:hypothetical protein
MFHQSWCFDCIGLTTFQPGSFGDLQTVIVGSGLTPRAAAHRSRSCYLSPSNIRQTLLRSQHKLGVRQSKAALACYFHLTGELDRPGYARRALG